MLVLALLLFLSFGAAIFFSFNFENIFGKTSLDYNIFNIILGRNLSGPIVVDGCNVFIDYDLFQEIEVSNGVRRFFNISKPPLIYREKRDNQNIVVLGDSFTFAAGVLENASWPFFLNEIINSNVINLAIPGINTNISIERFAKLGVDYHPQIVIYQYSFNDFQESYLLFSAIEAVIDKINITHEDSEYLFNSKFQNFYEDEIYPLNWRGIFNKSVLAPLIKLHNLSKNHNFEVLILTVPGNERELDEVKRLCDNFNWPIIEVGKDIEFEWKPPFTLDDGHFSVQTHKKVAELLKLKLENAKLS